MAPLIPADPAAELLDADLAPEPVFALRRDGREWVRFGNGFQVAAPQSVRFPIVRCVRPGLALLVDARAEAGRPNAWLLTGRGDAVRAFHVGDGVADVLVCGPLLVVTYFDEGIFGGGALAGEGLAVFDQRGALRWGYRSRFAGSGPIIDDCYVACTDGRDRVWFSPYMAFPLVELRLSEGTQQVTRLPERLHGSHALTTDGTGFWFHAPYAEPDAILRWSPASGAVTACRAHAGRLRGLAGGRFLQVRPDGYEVIL